MQNCLVNTTCIWNVFHSILGWMTWWSVSRVSAFNQTLPANLVWIFSFIWVFMFDTIRILRIWGISGCLLDVCETACLPPSCAVIWPHSMLLVHLKAFLTPVWIKGKGKFVLRLPWGHMWKGKYSFAYS
jgi:hypothetical protein